LNKSSIERSDHFGAKSPFERLVQTLRHAGIEQISTV
jgi:hypothetical protein